MPISALIGVVVKLFLLLTPFFVLSIFITLSQEMSARERKRLAVRTALAVLFILLVLYMFGDLLFRYLGITLNAFRIGAGLVLMLSGIDLVRATGEQPKARRVAGGNSNDLAVVPLAIPCTVGPGTIGMLLVMGADSASFKARISGMIAVMIAATLLGLMLYFSEAITRILQRKGVNILSKLTGMYLVALAAQIMADGIRGMLQ